MIAVCAGRREDGGIGNRRAVVASRKYSGYALGMGVERITNLKYRVSDLRLFSENDVRFLEQFKAAH